MSTKGNTDCTFCSKQIRRFTVLSLQLAKKHICPKHFEKQSYASYIGPTYNNLTLTAQHNREAASYLAQNIPQISVLLLFSVSCFPLSMSRVISAGCWGRSPNCFISELLPLQLWALAILHRFLIIVVGVL